MKVITCIEDLRVLHQRRVPRMFYDYAESGSWTQSTFRRNAEVFSEIQLRQRVAKDISQRSIEGQMLGETWAMPVALAPTGLTGMQHANGEILAAQAAEAFGVPFTLSTMSICSIEDVAANTQKPFWFQLYVMKDREFISALIQRAKAANCSALVLTLDLQIIGQRHKDVKNQMTAPPKLTLTNLINMATKPRRCMGMMATRRHSLGNVVGHAKGVENLTSLSDWSAELEDAGLSRADEAWVQEECGGKLILNWIMDSEDACIAAGLGVDAIIVSNHGGRQLDGAPASMDVLPDVIDAVAGRCEVWLDGGIRSGQDVFKAKAMGAEGTLIGKAFLNGLGALGKIGVTQCLEIIAKELDLTMAFCGKTKLSEVGGDVIWRG